MISAIPSESLESILLGLVALLVVGVAIGLYLLGQALARLKSLSVALARLDALEGIARKLETLGVDERALDLRRLEHVLIDIRDGQKRLEERLLVMAELRATAGADARAVLPGGATSGAALVERVMNRLLALGYERIQIVTASEALALVAAHDGDLVIEARRDGVPCKGRVLVRGGAISDLHIQSAYTTFP